MEIQKLNYEIEKSNKAYMRLVDLHNLKDPLVYSQIAFVDKLVSNLMNNYNFTPSWITDYNKLCSKYFIINFEKLFFSIN